MNCGTQTSDHGARPTLWERILGAGFAFGLRALASTWRVDIDGLDVLHGLAESRQPHVLAFWHRHYITLFRLFRDRSTIALTNESHRGQVIANICARNNILALQVREHAANHTLRSLRHLGDGHLGLAITVDGPLGPACEVKPVVLHLAFKLGWPVVPVSVASKRSLILSNRWDRLEIPSLFTRVSYVVGDPIDMSALGTHEQLSRGAMELKDAINRGTRLAMLHANSIAN